MKKLKLPELLVLNAYWVGLSFKWNALHPIILPAVLLNFVPDARKNTYLGLLTFVGLVLAMVIQPLAGAVSDGWVSRWGRRRPLIVLGTLFDFVFLGVLAWAGGTSTGSVQSLTWVFIGYIGLQFSSNIAQGPAQGLLPDRVPPEQLGVASSWKNVMDMTSLIIASLLAGRLLDPVTRDPILIVLVLMGTIAISTAITVLGTREKPSPPTPLPGGEGNFRALRGNFFHIDFHSNRAYWWLIAERGSFLLGIYGVQAFAQYYLQDVIRVADPPKQTGDLLAVLTLSLVALVLVGGWLTDKFGAKRMLYIASTLAAAGMLLMLIPRDMPGLMAFGGVLGAGIGLFLTANWALANKLAPGEEAGKFLGLTNLATAGSGALARLEGPALDWLNGLWPGQWMGYTWLFVFGAVCILFSMLSLRKINEKSL
ncbi:MAG: MFS transporter [Anaerolineales bacterium]|nr:MFS transporter [Anaerolineales bacterium]